jgi:hypothetical protein
VLSCTLPAWPTKGEGHEKTLVADDGFEFVARIGPGSTSEELVNGVNNADNVITQSMGYDRKNYSPLTKAFLRVKKSKSGPSAARMRCLTPGDVVGHFVAINPLTGEKKWEIPLTALRGG